jgi:hypothetical protein
VTVNGERESLPIEYVEKAVEQVPAIGWLLAPLFKRVAQGVAKEWERKGSVALKAAERASGMSREELEDAINTVPGMIPLTVRVLWAAGVNGHDATLKAMGATLGHAVREPERMSEVELILAAMADFGPNHRAVLEALEAKPTDAYWGDADFPQHVNIPQSIVGLSLSGLNARGLVRGLVQMFPGTGKLTYDITELGRTVLEVLREVETEEGAR